MGKRPDPTISEILQMNDKVLQDFWEHYKKSISKAVKLKISVEDDHSFALLWMSLCHRFHKLKDLEGCKRKVLQLEKELEVVEEEAPMISTGYISCNYIVMSDQEMGLKKKPRKIPTTDEINFEKDPMLQYLWNAFKGSICEAEKSKLNPSKDCQSSILLDCVYQRFNDPKKLDQKIPVAIEISREESEIKELSFSRPLVSKDPSVSTIMLVSSTPWSFDQQQKEDQQNSQQEELHF